MAAARTACRDSDAIGSHFPRSEDFGAPETHWDRKFTPTDQVRSWLPVVRSEIKRSDLVGGVDPYMVLALIHLESGGNDLKTCKSREHVGLLQIEDRVAQDAGLTSRWSAYGDGRISIHIFLTWSKRYETLHQWDTDLLALGWKAGSGTLETVRKWIEDERPKEDIARWLEDDRWGAWTYLEKFRAAYTVWSAFRSGAWESST